MCPYYSAQTHAMGFVGVVAGTIDSDSQNQRYHPRKILSEPGLEWLRRISSENGEKKNGQRHESIHEWSDVPWL